MHPPKPPEEDHIIAPATFVTYGREPRIHLCDAHRQHTTQMFERYDGSPRGCDVCGESLAPEVAATMDDRERAEVLAPRLAACPFCGTSHPTWSAHAHADGYPLAHCGTCGADGPTADKEGDYEDALRKWNKRASHLTWKYNVGTRITLNNPDKAEHGSKGRITAIQVYGGPAILDMWEYQVTWDSGFLNGMTTMCPERWTDRVPDGDDDAC